MNPLKHVVRKIDFWRRGIVVWSPANVYANAQIGSSVSIGMYAEIGAVKVGNKVRIGAMCFIPTGVEIEDMAWIGPRCTFTNDRYPPSPRDKWEHTVVKKGAALGAGVTVLPGVTIGEGALVGAGSVVVCDIPPWEIWAGNPAIKLTKKNGG